MNKRILQTNKKGNPVEKQAKAMGRKFTAKKSKLANKYVKRWSTHD